MNVKANIWFEKLHRYVYDNHYVQDAFKLRLTKKDKIKIYFAVKLYKIIYPYFEGWRFSLKITFPNERKYIRYEPKVLDLMDYEYRQLNKDLKLKYLEFKLKECKQKNLKNVKVNE